MDAGASDAGDLGSDGGGDAGGDAAPGDLGSDMPLVTCTPDEWFCDAAGTGAAYCNGTGDGVLSAVGCNGRACADGFCEPRVGIGRLCDTLINGQRGEIVGG
ncbi:MAG: hypothetical protein AAF447_24880, partial [Myxococcota bacterium]